MAVLAETGASHLPISSPSPIESGPVLPANRGLMTKDNIQELHEAFQSLPGVRRVEEGFEVEDIPMSIIATDGKYRDMEARLVLTNPNATTRKDKRKVNVGPVVFRGIKRFIPDNHESGEWRAAFTREDSDGVEFYDVKTVELESLHELEPIRGNFKGKHIISLSQFEREDLETVFAFTPQMKQICLGGLPSKILSGLIVASLFYKESSRTRMSTEAAIQQLGGSVVSMVDPTYSSEAKGESLEHSMLTYEAYVDAIVLRHGETGSAAKAGKWLKRVPLLNAGDGNGEHPTQAILDLITIRNEVGRLDHLNAVVAGDLSHGRTVHSLVQGLALYPGNSITFLSNDVLKLPEEYKRKIIDRGVDVREIDRIEDIPKDADFWYWTRSQTERYTEEEKALLGADWEKQFVVSQKVLDTYAGPNTILMHPLPINSKNPEVLREVQDDPRTVYLEEEIRNGMYSRMTLLALTTGRLRPNTLSSNPPLIF